MSAGTATRPARPGGTGRVDPPPRPTGRSRLDRIRSRGAWGFAAPALLVVAAVTIFPVVYSIVLSFADVEVGYEGFTIQSFGFDN